MQTEGSSRGRVGNNNGNNKSNSNSNNNNNRISKRSFSLKHCVLRILSQTWSGLASPSFREMAPRLRLVCCSPRVRSSRRRRQRTSPGLAQVTPSMHNSLSSRTSPRDVSSMHLFPQFTPMDIRPRRRATEHCRFLSPSLSSIPSRSSTLARLQRHRRPWT